MREAVRAVTGRIEVAGIGQNIVLGTRLQDDLVNEHLGQGQLQRPAVGTLKCLANAVGLAADDGKLVSSLNQSRVQGQTLDRFEIRIGWRLALGRVSPRAII